MFLNTVLRRNRPLVEACVALHQQGKIPANSYVLDIDTIRDNASFMMGEAKKSGLKLFPMTKQLGRNPEVLKALKEAGVEACVCVDMSDARPVHASGLRVGHLGHLVQVPFAETKAAADMRPDNWTVYSLDKAEAISKIMPKDSVQQVMARIWADGDRFYTGHEGGFPAGEIEKTAAAIAAMPGLEFAGLTTFPAQLFDHGSKAVQDTPNLKTLLDTAGRLRKALGGHLEINAPGTTSSLLFKKLAAAGVTQVEPGHGLTGTCPQHAFAELPERPVMVYVTEVSHRHQGKDYCYGGGMYIDPVFGEYDVNACVGNIPEEAVKRRILCAMPKPESIDYYGILQTSAGERVSTGDTVVFAFRAQIFVTRAYVVPVAGIAAGEPRVLGIYGPDGRSAGWPAW